MAGVFAKYGGQMALLVCAMIWGTGFIAQKLGMEFLEPCSFNASRSFIGALALIPVVMLMDCMGGRRPSVWGSAQSAAARRKLLIGGVACGAALGVAAMLQQYGIKHTTIAKAGFISALYILMVPILGLFIGRRTGKAIWVCCVSAMAGMYLLCCAGESTVGFGDMVTLGCAVVFAMHILVIAHYAPEVDCVRMSLLQFLVAGVISIPVALAAGERPALMDFCRALPAVAYCGIMSSGVAYTLQIIGQRYVQPATASLLLSLESVFAALAAWIILKQTMNWTEFLGCVVIFVSVLAAQMPQKTRGNPVA